MASCVPVGDISTTVKCADRACSTGQVISSTSNTARKVSSHFFGRNKTATKAIDFHVWHVLCRMSYQRSRYAADRLGSKSLCQYYIDHLKQQLIRLKLWRPEAKFEVGLWEAARKRLSKYHDSLRRGGTVEEAKKQVAVDAGPSKKDGKKMKTLNVADAVSMEHAEYIDEHLAGQNKTVDYIIDEVVAWIQQEVDSGAMLQMPPIEFLINEPAKGESVNDPKSNYARWEAFVDGVAYHPSELKIESSPTPARKKQPVLKRLSSPQLRPPIKLDLSLARFRATPSSISSSEKKKSKGSSPVDSLPLYQPPSPTLLKALKRKDKIRSLSVDTALANSCAVGLAATSSSSQLDSSLTVMEGTPTMARGMVFAGGKPKVVPRKRAIEEVYDSDETESEGEGSEVQRKKAKVA